MDNLRVGVVGSGGMGTRRAELFESLKECKVVGLAARNSDTGPALAAKLGIQLSKGWEDLVAREDIDAIAVCTNNELHGAIILRALASGKHVFTEYPIVRHIEEAKAIRALLKAPGPVLRVAHSETVSGTHQSLRTVVNELGEMLAIFFQRLTPGRGARPEVLFNLDLSGPPALFFVYHMYAMVDLFGPASWVECGAKYQNLTRDGGYHRFVNSVTVGFEQGGLGQWNWAGGIEIQQAEESMSILLEGGSLLRKGGDWHISKQDESIPLKSVENETTLEEQFVQEILTGSESWKKDASTALDAAGIGLAAEQSVKLNQRVHIE